MRHLHRLLSCCRKPSCRALHPAGGRPCRSLVGAVRRKKSEGKPRRHELLGKTVLGWGPTQDQDNDVIAWCAGTITGAIVTSCEMRRRPIRQARLVLRVTLIPNELTSYRPAFCWTSCAQDPIESGTAKKKKLSMWRVMREGRDGGGESQADTNFSDDAKKRQVAWCAGTISGAIATSKYDDGQSGTPDRFCSDSHS